MKARIKKTGEMTEVKPTIIGYTDKDYTTFYYPSELDFNVEVDGEEMPCVSRKKVQEIYTQNQKEINRENTSSSDKDCYEYANEVLKTRFGSKCLPDEASSASSTESDVSSSETKPSEPKFKVGDKVRIPRTMSCTQDGINWDNIQSGTIATVKSAYLSLDDDSIWIYRFEEAIHELAEGWLEPYTEPEKEDHIAQDLDMVSDRRLMVAAMAMQGILSRGVAPRIDDRPQTIAEAAFRYADALIAESNKGC